MFIFIDDLYFFVGAPRIFKTKQLCNYSRVSIICGTDILWLNSFTAV